MLNGSHPIVRFGRQFELLAKLWSERDAVRNDVVPDY